MASQAMTDVIIPEGFLRFSDAISRLTEGMWGGLQRPVPVQTIKRFDKDASIVFGPWREQAGKRFTAAVRKEELPVYVLAKPQAKLRKRARARSGPMLAKPRVKLRKPTGAPPRPQQPEPVAVPVKVLSGLRATRGGILPDHPIRPSIRTAEGDEKLLASLISGLLVIRVSDFDVWYRFERAKGKWPSQLTKVRIGRGRPTKQTEQLRIAVTTLVRDAKWSSELGVAKLRRLLIDAGKTEAPSTETLGRVVDRLHHETGEAEFFRPKRSRRKRN